MDGKIIIASNRAWGRGGGKQYRLPQIPALPHQASSVILANSPAQLFVNMAIQTTHNLWVTKNNSITALARCDVSGWGTEESV